ncbi:hypothetical protein HYT18_03465 [Candidatus Microgenomates bacterium]|nr:hypothetical protein [Candidatus Microgenomates bacterium]
MNRDQAYQEERLRSHNMDDRIINGIKAHHDGIKKTRDNYLERAVVILSVTKDL